MKLLELIEQVNKRDILEYLIKHDGDSAILEFEKMIDTLKNITPIIDPKFKILICKMKDIFDGSEYMAVSGYKEEDGESYALEFTPWEEWLGFEILEGSIKEYGKVCVIAECLMEMSFISFNQIDIVNKRKTIDEEIENIKNGTAELITLEDIEKEYANEKNISYEEYKKNSEEKLKEYEEECTIKRGNKSVQDIIAENKAEIKKILNLSQIPLDI